MWEEVARRVRAMGGEILTGWRAARIYSDGARVKSVEAIHTAGGEDRVFEGDYFFSTMPIQELVRALNDPPPHEIREIGEGLMYRDFIAVGLLMKELKVK